MDAAEIQEFMRTKVARHKRLMGGVSFIDEIPKNPVSAEPSATTVFPTNGKQSGKILRKTLREQAKKEVGDTAVRESRL